LFGSIFAAVPKIGAVVENLRARGAALECLDAAGVAIGGPDDAFVLHLVGEVERLAAFARAASHQFSPGFGAAATPTSCEARSWISNSPVRNCSVLNKSCVPVKRSASGPRSLGSQAKKRFCEYLTLTGPRAEPQRGIALELAEVVGLRFGGKIEFGPQPSGHGADGERLGLDAFRIGGKALVEFDGVFEAFFAATPSGRARRASGE